MSIEQFEQPANVLYLITHDHKFGKSTYTAVLKAGEDFDLNKFAMQQNIDYEPERGENLEFETLDLPDGFVVVTASEKDQKEDAIDRLSQLVSDDNPDHIEGLDEAIHDLYDSAASRINNAGVREQIKYLIFELGEKEAEQKILTVIDTPLAFPGQG